MGFYNINAKRRPHPPSKEYDALEYKNIYELWRDNNGKTPFLVRRRFWFPTTYFVVKWVRGPHYYPNGFFGEAVGGDLYLRGVLHQAKTTIRSAGSYQWQQVKQEELDLLLLEYPPQPPSPVQGRTSEGR